MDTAVRVRLCPSLAIERGGATLRDEDLPGRQARTVLAALILEGGRPLTRAELAEQLWPGGAPRSSDDSLNAILSRLRRALRAVGLDAADALVASKGRIRLALPPASEVDVEMAARAVAAAEAAARDGDHRAAVAEASAAWSVLQHELLAGETAPLVEERRARLASLRLRALEARAAGHLGAGAWQAAIDEAERAVATDPFRESAWRLLMTAHARAGSTAGALAVWERCRKVLADELGTEPSPETQQVYLELLHHLPAAPAAGERDLATLVAAAAAAAGGPDETAALREVDEAYPSVRQTLRALVVDGADPDAGLRMCVDLAAFWLIRGWWHEGRAWLERALGAADRAHPLRPAAVRWLGEIAWRSGDLNTAEEALREVAGTGDGVGALARTGLAAVALSRGDTDRAHDLFDQVLRDTDDEALAARCLTGLGVIAARRSEFARARELFERSLSAHRRLGDLRNIAMCLSNLSSAVGSQGSALEARAYAEEALAIRRQLGDSAGVALSLVNLGILHKSAGETDRAVERLSESLAIRRQIGDRAGIVGCLNALGDAVRATGDDRRALGLYREAIEIARAIPDRERLCLALLSAANVEVALEAADEAGALVKEATALAEMLGSETLRAAALEASAAVAATSGAQDHARDLLREAEDLRARIGAPLSPADRADIERTRALITR